jgi:hypothetical protein
MCPACIATATLVMTSATSAGGVAALVMKIFCAKNGAGRSLDQPKSKEDPK